MKFLFNQIGLPRVLLLFTGCLNAFNSKNLPTIERSVRELFQEFRCALNGKEFKKVNQQNQEEKETKQ